MGLQNLSKQGQMLSGLRTQSLDEHDHQQFDDQQVRNIGFGADSHHRIIRHAQANHQISQGGQRGVGLGDRDDLGASRFRKSDRLLQYRMAGSAQKLGTVLVRHENQNIVAGTQITTPCEVSG